MAIESACIPLPSEIIMPLSGWMLIKEQGLSAIHVLWAGFYGALGCLLGSIIAYWVGAWVGRRGLERYGKYVLISPHELDRAEHWFNRYGDRVVFFSRLLPHPPKGGRGNRKALGNKQIWFFPTISILSNFEQEGSTFNESATSRIIKLRKRLCKGNFWRENGAV